MEGLKSALESAVTITYSKAVIEDKATLDEDELSSGIQVNFGYPQAEQRTSLDLILDLNDDWNVTDGGNTVIFTFEDDTGDMTTDAINTDSSVCKITYSPSESEGVRPDISISGTGCTD